MSEPKRQSTKQPADGSGTFEKLGRKLDERPEIQAAEEALRVAQEQLQRARQQYHDIRAQAVETAQGGGERTFADVIATTLDLVRKHPGPGVLLALACGWFVGRLFRR